jgi:hypothetical protein
MTQRSLDIVNALATDQRTVAERQWQERTRPPTPQQPCDVGLFGDDHKQLGLSLAHKGNNHERQD